MKEGIEHVSDKEEEEGMEDNKGSSGASMHSSILTTLNVLITMWTLIWAINFLLYYHLCPKNPFSKFSTMRPSFIAQTYMTFRIIVQSMHTMWNVLAFFVNEC